MPKKETKRLLIIMVATNLLIIGLFIYVYNYTNNLINKSINTESDIKIELQKQDARIMMKNDLISSKTYQEKLKEYIVPSEGTVNFIKLLEQLALNSNIKSDIKNVATENDNKNILASTELIRINMDVLGEWKNVQFFITLLENYPLKIEIKNVYLNKFSENVVRGKSISQWAGNIEFTVLKYKDQQ